ncbi:terminase large subunit [Dokdonella sp. MW10]|uniref:terminase large subunit n=1 Tax=Dokdonella sp. MW10 TaxID=2992926 RepID=UPI003F7E7D30
MAARKATPHVDRMESYVAGVLSGDIIACEWIVLACERHRRDREAKASFPYRFDPERAERVCRFAARFPHVKGRWASKGETLRLEGWQCFGIGSIFGWVHKKTGLRRFRKARLYLPRKNGKSLLVAPIGLYMFTADGEPGAEVYSGATTEKQAWEVFGPARAMAQRMPDYLEFYGVAVNAKSLTRESDLSKFEPIIGQPGDGSSPHCSITDEYHEHATDAQLATMETGMGARTQPLSIVVSTAGDNVAGPCRDDWLECQKMLQGITHDDRLFALIYTVDKDDDWTSEASLRKANPNYDVSVDGEFLLAQQRDAINNPRKQGHFKTKHLNLWVQARDAFINMQKWAQNKRARKLDDFKGRRCYVGLDLASKIDLAAVVLLFEDGDDYYVFGKYYLPEATVELAENQHYQGWHKEGHLSVTPGNMIDHAQILDDLQQLAKVFEIAEIAYDPHNATMLVTACQAAGLPMVEFAQTVLNFSEPMKQVEALIVDHHLLHDGDPVMNWAMSNVTAKIDRKDNVFPNKERKENKIDPFVALCMAMGRAMVKTDTGDMDGFFDTPVRA